MVHFKHNVYRGWYVKDLDDSTRDSDEIRFNELIEQEKRNEENERNEVLLSDIEKTTVETTEQSGVAAAKYREPLNADGVSSAASTHVPTTTTTVGGSDSDGENSKKSRFKKYFLYTLVAGLILCALISVVAVLIGEFNDAMTNALSTTASMVVHTCLLLFFVSGITQKSNSLIVNTLITITILSFITSLLGIWSIIEGQIIGDLYLLYFYTFCFSLWAQLLLFIGENRLDKLTRITSKIAIAASTLFYLLLIPTIFVNYPDTLPEIFYRCIAATVIILATTSVLCAVFRRIYLAKHPQLKNEKSLHSGLDVVIALVALIIGIPTVFALMASIAVQSRIDEQRYDATYSESPSPSVEPEATDTFDVIDCTELPEYAQAKWQMSKYVYYYGRADLTTRTLSFSEAQFEEPLITKPYDSELIVVDANCAPYSLEDINANDPVTYYSLKSQAGKINETVTMLQAADERADRLDSEGSSEQSL